MRVPSLVVIVFIVQSCCRLVVPWCTPVTIVQGFVKRQLHLLKETPPAGPASRAEAHCGAESAQAKALHPIEEGEIGAGKEQKSFEKIKPCSVGVVLTADGKQFLEQARRIL